MKNQTCSNKTRDQIRQIILETISEQKPETSQQLIKMLQDKLVLPTKEIMYLLVQLENDNALHFTKKETSLSQTPRAYVFSKKATWYWATVMFALVTSLAVFTIPSNVYPTVYLRSVLGIVFVLFLPGYAFIKMLFPLKIPFPTISKTLENIERAALSFGMSIVLVPVTGLILNFTPWGIRLTPITFSILGLTVIFATVAILREYQIKAQDARSFTIS